MTVTTIPRVGPLWSPVFYDKQVQEWVAEGIISFSGGVASYPRDFAIGAHVLVALVGQLGPVEQVKARIKLNSAIRTMNDLIPDLPSVAKTAWICIRYLTQNKTTRCAGLNLALEGLKTEAAQKEAVMRGLRFGGRYAGGKVVKFVLTGGPYGAAARKGQAGLAISAGFFTVTALGAMIRLAANAKSKPSALDIMSAILLGVSDGSVVPETIFKKIYDEVAKCVSVDVDRNEIAGMEREIRAVIKDLRTTRNGGR